MQYQSKSEEAQKEWDTFVHNIVWLRKENGFSKKEMAKILGIGIATLNKIENGEMPQRLGVNVFFHIRSQFGISVKDQLTRRLDGH